MDWNADSTCGGNNLPAEPPGGCESKKLPRLESNETVATLLLNCLQFRVAALDAGDASNISARWPNKSTHGIVARSLFFCCTVLKLSLSVAPYRVYSHIAPYFSCTQRPGYPQPKERKKKRKKEKPPKEKEKTKERKPQPRKMESRLWFFFRFF